MNTNLKKVFLFLVMSSFLFSITSCKKKKDEKGKDKDVKVTKGKKTVKKVKVKPAKKSLIKEGAIKKALARKETKLPEFKTYKKLIKDIAEPCRKSKKYLSSFTDCVEYKKMYTEIEKTFKGIDIGAPKTVRTAIAIALAAVANLKDENVWVRYSALKVLDKAMYDFSYKKLTEPRSNLINAIAHIFKTSTDKNFEKIYEDRALALRLVGCDGGRAYFMGGKYEVKLLTFLATKDLSYWVRSYAVGYLLSAYKKMKEKSGFTPAKIIKWRKAEKKDDIKNKYVRVASEMGMKKEVYEWCSAKLIINKASWACYQGIYKVSKKADFDKYYELAKKHRDNAATKTSNHTTIAFLDNLCLGVSKKGFPKDKALGYVDSVLGQEATAKTRSKYVLWAGLKNLAKQAKTKKDIKKLVKKIKKLEKKYKKFNKADKKRSKEIKEMFGKMYKKLKEDAKKAK
jgi:hypothetical protein